MIVKKKEANTEVSPCRQERQTIVRIARQSGDDGGADRDRNSFDVYYDLVITLESALMKFALETDGKAMGSVDAKYN